VEQLEVREMKHETFWPEGEIEAQAAGAGNGRVPKWERRKDWRLEFI
jgi:hypothetical protein